MLKIINLQGIGKITMYPIAFSVCELGGDYYKNELEITMYPDKCYPDYTEVQHWIMTNIDGKVMNIEDVVNAVYNFLDETYEPYDVKVVDHVTECRTHFDVTVER